jgi:membrane protease YdiL (CAAX protease family)
MVVPLFLLSMCLGYIYQRTGNLWATITIHAAFNGVSVFAQLYGSG